MPIHTTLSHYSVAKGTVSMVTIATVRPPAEVIGWSSKYLSPVSQLGRSIYDTTCGFTSDCCFCF